MASAQNPLVVLLAGMIALPTFAQTFENPKVAQQQAKPQRMGGGEGVPPLPLPATPLRRTERKREPAPPALVGKLGFSGTGFRVVDGQRVPDDAWPSTIIDIRPLMGHVERSVGMKYRFVELPADKFSFDPAELPIVYITGWTPLPEFGDAVRQKFRQYVFDGGTIFFHSQCGRPEFNDSVRRELAAIFPDRPLTALDTDHPLFHCTNKIDSMRFRRNKEPMKTIPPYLEAVHIGVRAAVIFSPIDLSTGWDVASNPIEGGVLYDMGDARRLGVNVISYCLANTSYARTFAIEKIFHEQGEPRRDEFVLAQVVHSADWDPTPHALPNLVRHMKEQTSIAVKFKRAPVALADPKLAEHPVIFMTGLRDFTLTEPEVLNLRRYLENGGKLIAESGGGWSGFDTAFRREIRRVLPETTLQPLAPDHPVYSANFDIRQVRLSDAARAAYPGLSTPLIESITVNGQPVVLYSPIALSRGWEAFDDPYTRRYESQDALRLGINLFTYAMMN